VNFPSDPEAAEKELDQEAERLTAELGELHRRLESGAITVESFDAREHRILDRLDELQEQTTNGHKARRGQRNLPDEQESNGRNSDARQ
jgi:hypothetical protein